MKAPRMAAATALLLTLDIASAQEVSGSLTANGKSVPLKYVQAQEVDSKTEKGYMDVIVVVSDRKLSAADVQDIERLEALVRRDGLVAVAVRINPDARVMSAEPLHPAFTTFVSSAAFIQWTPSAYDEKRIAGRFSTDGVQSTFGQKWGYDVTFAAPIDLDPGARTVPRK
jgi:hypothetical protein